jgi:tetratricopeptide (TPR) repeat protein
MADIFVSYTSSDRDWAFWIGSELEAIGHTVHLHDWEIAGGCNIIKWMAERIDAADHVLCVASKAYFEKPYSTHERTAAEWAALTERSNFALPVFVEPCEAPRLFAPLKRCDLYGVAEQDARARLKAFLEPAIRPPHPLPFPGGSKSRSDAAPVPPSPPFPGKTAALTNIPIRVPLHFLGRDDALATIEASLRRDDGRVVITALHGLRGVGKTTLAAAYAERHRANYRATWWIGAQTESTLRADLMALGVRLGWINTDEKQEQAVAAVMERLRHEGDGILLIFDNAVNVDALKAYLPLGGVARVLITSNSGAFRGVAVPVEIRVWPKEIGADYLIGRTGRGTERTAAEDLSEALGGLPLAHEQAAAYCERLQISFADYQKRFEAAPVRLLDDARHAPAEYYNGRTVAKTFALAIEEAANLHPAAEPLITYAALLEPEAIPLFLFAEARKKFGEPLASALADDGLDEVVAALLAFALVDRETIPDERDPTITTDSIRLHRLVREVTAARCEREAQVSKRGALLAALAAVYPSDIYNNSATWPRARRLDSFALALASSVPPAGVTKVTLRGVSPVVTSTTTAIAECQIYLLNGLASYRDMALEDYAQSKQLRERSLAITEKVHGPEDPETGRTLVNLGLALSRQDDKAGARECHERALKIFENALGPEHPDTARALINLASVLAETDIAKARPLYDRASAIFEKALPDHPDTGRILHNRARFLRIQGDLESARRLFERALAIFENALGLAHPDTARSLSSLAYIHILQNDRPGAVPRLEQALAIRERALGPDHPETAAVRSWLDRMRCSPSDNQEN